MVVLVATDIEWTGPIEVQIEGQEKIRWAASGNEEVDEGGEAGPEGDQPCGPDAIIVERGRLSLHAKGQRGFHWRLEEDLEEAGCHVIELSLANTISTFYAFLAGTEAVLPLRVFVDGVALVEVEGTVTDDEFQAMQAAGWLRDSEGEVVDWLPGELRRGFLEFEADGKAALFIGPAGTYEVLSILPGGHESVRTERLREGAIGHEFISVYTLTSME